MKIPNGISLAEFTKAYLDKKSAIDKKKYSIEAIAAEMGISRSYLSQYKNGTYGSDPKTIEDAIIAYFDKIEDEGGETGESEAAGESAGTEVKKQYSGIIPAFLATEDAMKVNAICQACQEYSDLGVIIGRPGFGKTYILQNYSRKRRVYYLECNDSMIGRDLVRAIENKIGILRGTGTIDERIEGIKDFFNTNSGYLLIIDEADKLMTRYSTEKMEILRTIFDQSNVGIVVAGEPSLESMLKMYLPRFAERTEYCVELSGLLAEEERDYISNFNCSESAVKELVSRGINPKTGTFRRLNKTLNAITRMIKPDEEITMHTITEVSRMMMKR